MSPGGEAGAGQRRTSADEKRASSASETVAHPVGSATGTAALAYARRGDGVAS